MYYFIIGLHGNRDILRIYLGGEYICSPHTLVHRTCADGLHEGVNDGLDVGPKNGLNGVRNLDIIENTCEVPRKFIDRISRNRNIDENFEDVIAMVIEQSEEKADVRQNSVYIEHESYQIEENVDDYDSGNKLNLFGDTDEKYLLDNEHYVDPE